MEKPTALKGINFKSNPAGEIYIGIHLSTLLSEITESQNKNGWVNLKIVPYHKPSAKGYSHKAILNERKTMEGNTDKAAKVLTSN